jgi:GNAT superfamily N-acetyltransferase
MQELIYRSMTIGECDKISEINPKHHIKNAWRLIDGKRQLVKIDYMENDWPDGYDTYRVELENILSCGGTAFGAFDNEDKLHGFISLDKRIFGETKKYMLLDSMFVSYSSRGFGIGKKLFKLCCEEAKASLADKIYICAGSAEDTVAFYKSCGCNEAMEINRELFEQDQRDLQLEYELIAK